MYTLIIADNSRKDQFCIHTTDSEQYNLLLAGITLNTRFTLISSEYVKG